MKKFILIFIILAVSFQAKGDTIYFPPTSGSLWDTISPQSMNWDIEKIDTLYKFLEKKNTKAFILLKGGKIVLEKYFNNYTKDSLWYWASAGKTLTSALIGIAQEDGLLSIEDKTSDYLGAGWTSCPSEKEALITIRHQLTMTTGLEYNVNDLDCTDSECLKYKTDAGSQWYYHNAAYTLLENVVENASGKSFNQYFFQKIRNKIGMNGVWLKSGFNNVYYSTARSMARFGILIASNGNWETEEIIKDKSYLNQMINTSQNMNKSYGYLWWLNGKSSSMIPGTSIVFNTMLMPDAPLDAFAALGKNGQILCIAPSQDLILVRMGNEPDDQFFISTKFANDIWKLLNEVTDTKTNVNEESLNNCISPNPANVYIDINLEILTKSSRLSKLEEIKIYNTYGEIVLVEQMSSSVHNGHFSNGETVWANGILPLQKRIDISQIPAGLYFIQIGNYTEKFVVIR